MTINRRKFIKTAAIGTAAVTSLAGSTSAMTAASYRSISGSNEQLRFGVVGFRSRGRALIGGIRKSKSGLAAVCDADSTVVEKFEPDNKKLIRSTNFDKLLDDKNIDAIASATPNHWHTLLTMLALEAGKHVYIEKPISHNMLESQMVVRAARKHNKIVQCGFQNRSDKGLVPFYEKLRAGDYGKVVHVHGTCHRSRNSIGKLDKPLTVPKHIDYQQWLGPAEDQPLMRPQFHYDWHWDFNTGNGDVGNQGPHEWDLMNWALGDPAELPQTMIASGNRFGWNDAGNTPNIMGCHGNVNGIDFCFEVMDLKGGAKAPYGRGVGIIIETEKGRFVGGRGGGQFTFKNGESEKFKGGDATNAHMANFVEAVANNDRNVQRSECAIAANSAAMAHMANISFQLAEESSPKEVLKAYDSSEPSKSMIERLNESTIRFAGGKSPNEPWMLGPKLTFDNQAFEFTGQMASQANQKMSRDYRSNFELPKV